ncbi:MAG: DNA-directed RNA polymerase subunit K [Candidatus Aenigmarchaeota archaeon]|nr:DNA-directed RNA polymerase subunit K [Candidatus Aenigmarchaeota archaeon]
MISPEEYTRFEKTRIISARALQIAMGAPLLISAKSNEIDPIELAEREFENNLIPMTVRRKFPKKIE